MPFRVNNAMKRILPEFEFTDEQLNKIAALASKCGLTKTAASILYGRGVDTPEKVEAFVYPSRKHFISPFKMRGMKEACELIRRAEEEEWDVLVYGDYDADGRVRVNDNGRRAERYRRKRARVRARKAQRLRRHRGRARRNF